MFSNKFALIAASCGAVASLALLLQGNEDLPDAYLSICRGANHMVHSIGCESCAFPALPMLPVNPIDECRCVGNAGIGCLQCQNNPGEDGQICNKEAA